MKNKLLFYLLENFGREEYALFLKNKNFLNMFRIGCEIEMAGSSSDRNIMEEFADYLTKEKPYLLKHMRYKFVPIDYKQKRLTTGEDITQKKDLTNESEEEIEKEYTFTPKGDGSIATNNDYSHQVEIVFPEEGMLAESFFAILPEFFNFVKAKDFGTTTTTSVGLHVGLSFANEETYQKINLFKILSLISEEQIMMGYLKGGRITGYAVLIKPILYDFLKELNSNKIDIGKNELSFYQKILYLLDYKNKNNTDKIIRSFWTEGQYDTINTHHMTVNIFEEERIIKDYIEFRYIGSINPTKVSSSNKQINEEGTIGYMDMWEDIKNIILSYLIATYYARYDVTKYDKYIVSQSMKIGYRFTEREKISEETYAQQIEINKGSDFIKIEQVLSSNDKYKYSININNEKQFTLRNKDKNYSCLFNRNNMLFVNKTTGEIELYSKELDLREMGYTKIDNSKIPDILIKENVGIVPATFYYEKEDNEVVFIIIKSQYLSEEIIIYNDDNEVKVE